MFRPLVLVALVAGGAIAAPQEIPKVTWEDEDDFRLLAKDLENKFGGRIRFSGAIPRKEVKISVKDAGFFEALDALCRAYKDATYCPPTESDPRREHLTIMPGPWVEYPSAYAGHFKVALTTLLRVRRISPAGDTARVDASVVLFGPPWVSVTWSSGARVEWTFDEASDADGKDLLPVKGRPSATSPFGAFLGVDIVGNTSTGSVTLRDFDLSTGLKVFAGKVSLRAADTRIVRLDAKAGASVEVAQGTFTVDGVTEYERDEESTKWSVAVTFKPKDGPGGPATLEAVLERRARYAGESEWMHLNLPAGGRSFAVQTNDVDEAPAWIELRVRSGERALEIPFRFADVKFKGDSP